MLAFRSAIRLSRPVIQPQSKRNFIKFSRDTENKSIKMSWTGLPLKISRDVENNSIKLTWVGLSNQPNEKIKIDKDNVDKVCDYFNRCENSYNKLFLASLISSFPLTLIHCMDYHGNSSFLFQTLCLSNFLAGYYFFSKSNHFVNMKISGEVLPSDINIYLGNIESMVAFILISIVPALAIAINQNFFITGTQSLDLIAVIPFTSAILYTCLTILQRRKYNDKIFQSLTKN